MAKAKKSRRARRQEIAKRKQSQTPVSPETTAAVEPAVEETSAPQPDEAAAQPVVKRNAVDFAKEYYYVYAELRSILIVATVTFLIMVSLAFFI